MLNVKSLMGNANFQGIATTTLDVLQKVLFF